MSSNVSVIITCYKERELIHRAMESLNNQTDKDFSIILVYDASKDDITESICKEYESRENVTVIWNKKNLGLSGARNAAIKEMCGEIIVFLDADDTLPPKTIEIIKKEFREHPDADFFFGNYTLHSVENNDEKEVDCSILANDKGLLSPSAFLQNWILLGTSPMKKSFFIRNNGYSLDFSNSCQDIDFWMRAYITDTKGYYTRNCIYNWYKSTNGMNSSSANINDIDRCIISNIKFYILFDPNTKELYKYLYKINDIKSIKQRAYLELKKGNKNKRNRFYAYAPESLIKIVSRFTS